MPDDLVLRGGSVLDGTGAPPRTADVAIADGRIVEVGRASAPGGRVIDISGAVVCPGFIDLHSHADFTVFGAPEAVTQVTQGVTTLVTGNCGFSPFPIVPEHRDDLLSARLPVPSARTMRSSSSHEQVSVDAGSWEWTTAGEYAAEVKRLPLGVNLALQVGHGAVRIAAMGLADRVPSDDELERMQGFVREAIAGGAVGFSTGLIYAPGMFASAEEVTSLASVAASAGKLYSTHMRDEHAGLGESVREALSVARETGVRLEISHLKAAGVENWGTVSAAVELVESARREGVDVAVDQYPYTASSTTLTALLPAWTMDGGVPALLDRLRDQAASARLAEELSRSAGRSFWPERVVVADTVAGPYSSFVGQSLSDLAASLSVDSGAAVAELLRGQQGRVSVVHHSMSEDDVRHVMSQPFTSVASDGSVLGCPGAGKPHPRSFGTFARVLGRYVREKGLLALPEAVRRMTSLPASRLGWSDRGVLRPGAIADVAVFDPSIVTDNATFDDPWQLASGMQYTLLGGVPVLDSGVPTGAAAGTVVV